MSLVVKVILSRMGWSILVRWEGLGIRETPDVRMTEVRRLRLAFIYAHCCASRRKRAMWLVPKSSGTLCTITDLGRVIFTSGVAALTIRRASLPTHGRSGRILMRFSRQTCRADFASIIRSAHSFDPNSILRGQRLGELRLRRINRVGSGHSTPRIAQRLSQIVRLAFSLSEKLGKFSFGKIKYDQEVECNTDTRRQNDVSG